VTSVAQHAQQPAGISEKTQAARLSLTCHCETAVLGTSAKTSSGSDPCPNPVPPSPPASNRTAGGNLTRATTYENQNGIFDHEARFYGQSVESLVCWSRCQNAEDTFLVRVAGCVV